MYIYEYNNSFSLSYFYKKNAKHSSVSSCSNLYDKIITDTENKSSKYLREWIRPLKKQQKKAQLYTRLGLMRLIQHVEWCLKWTYSTTLKKFPK